MSDAKTMVITGASDGIGAAAAERLAAEGHRVIVLGRDPRKTVDVAGRVGGEHFVADFTDLVQVRSVAAELLERYPRIDVLANNAGGIFGDRAKTIDGFERTFQINHLAPFLLTNLLIERLVESRASVIQTSSTVRPARRIDLDDLDHDRTFTATRAYTAAKLENVLFTRELHRRFHHEGISAASYNPGNVASSFGIHSGSRLTRFITTNSVARRAMLTSPERGADTLVWLATGTPGRDWEAGGYFHGRRSVVARNRQADDAALALGLWQRSERLVGID